MVLLFTFYPVSYQSLHINLWSFTFNPDENYAKLSKSFLQIPLTFTDKDYLPPAKELNFKN